ncbi:MAG: hypothetical protein EOM50_03040 [Erysipelotrichia bacterium]|nr:hypothetical protein [Erysipelotrichia bacterium]NCC54258.1 hypothetical protein [Erysipelotrichia bacterium]
MKKISILLLFVMLLSGCSLFDVNGMVCEYPLDPVTYEVNYNGEDVSAFTIVEVRDYTNYKKAYFENKVEDAKKRSNEFNQIKGLNQEVSVDGKIISIYLKVDFNEYDIDVDANNVINLPLKKSDFENVKTLRKFFVNKGYHCDELVDSKLR